jgi:hypothetical protein
MVHQSKIMLAVYCLHLRIQTIFSNKLTWHGFWHYQKIFRQIFPYRNLTGVKYLLRTERGLKNVAWIKAAAFPTTSVVV